MYIVWEIIVEKDKRFGHQIEEEADNSKEEILEDVSRLERRRLSRPKRDKENTAKEKEQVVNFL
jgi:hypothetical protein